mgnify:CR=1 FL=1
MKHRDGRSLDHKALEDIRVGVVERVQAGESPEDVICTLGFSRSCIYAWLARYRQGGWEALKTPRLKGRPLKIQAAQMRWLCRTIVGKSPLQFRFEFALWTREMIAVLLWEKFQLRLRLVSITRLLPQLGLSCQRPLWRAWEQDPEGVRRRLAEEYPAIRAQARRAGAEIYWGDEAGARSDYHGGTTWGLQGQTPVARRTGGRSAVNMLSAISTRGQLRLFSLPPYSPELNPSEQAWNYVKHHGAARAALRGARELRRFVLARLRKQQKLPWTVRMFFLAPDTQYAAS